MLSVVDCNIIRKMRKEAMDERVRQLELTLEEMNKRAAERTQSVALPDRYESDVEDMDDPLGLQRDVSEAAMGHAIDNDACDDMGPVVNEQVATLTNAACNKLSNVSKTLEKYRYHQIALTLGPQKSIKIYGRSWGGQCRPGTMSSRRPKSR